jgi:hypothetical protein
MLITIGFRELRLNFIIIYRCKNVRYDLILMVRVYGGACRRNNIILN